MRTSRTRSNRCVASTLNGGSGSDTASCQVSVQQCKVEASAADCGNSKSDNGPPAEPPAYMSKERKKTSPINSERSSTGSGSVRESRCTHQKASKPNTKYSPAAATNALGAPTASARRSTNS